MKRIIDGTSFRLMAQKRREAIIDSIKRIQNCKTYRDKIDTTFHDYREYVLKLDHLEHEFRNLQRLHDLPQITVLTHEDHKEIEKLRGE